MIGKYIFISILFLLFFFFIVMILLYEQRLYTHFYLSCSLSLSHTKKCNDTSEYAYSLFVRNLINGNLFRFEANRFMDNIILKSLLYYFCYSDSKFIRRRMNQNERKNFFEQNDHNPKIRFVGPNVCVCVPVCCCLILITVWLMSFWNGSPFFGYSLSDHLISSFFDLLILNE